MVTIEEGVFTVDGFDGDPAESVLLTGEFDVDAMRAALVLAGQRCRGIDYLGREYGVDADVDQSVDHPHCKWYTVWPISDGGVTLSLDCQSYFTDAMGEAFRRILREEVVRAGLTALAVVAPDDEDVEYVGEPDEG